MPEARRISLTNEMAASRWYTIALGFFLIAGLFGFIMRLSWNIDLSFIDYRHILQAHSHVALLGWGLLAMGVALVALLLPKDQLVSRFQPVFMVSCLAGIGMAVFFPIQGYGTGSIIFCSLSLIAIYVLAYRLLRGLSKQEKDATNRFGRWAVIWLVVSTLSLLAIGPVSAMLGKSHPLYYACIQFFLHFQFNGWFTYAVIALVFWLFRRHKQEIDIPDWLFYCLQLSLLLTYTLSVTWSTPKSILFYLNSIGVLLQLLAVGGICYRIYKQLPGVLPLKGLVSWLIRFGLICLVAKVVVQSAVAVPQIAQISYTIRNFVVGFIHLSMLGATSLTLMGILIHVGILGNGKLSQWGYYLLIAAFILSEALLFVQGILFWVGAGFLPYYYTILTVVYALFPIALLLVLIGHWRHVDRLSLARSD